MSEQTSIDKAVWLDGINLRVLVVDPDVKDLAQSARYHEADVVLQDQGEGFAVLKCRLGLAQVIDQRFDLASFGAGEYAMPMLGQPGLYRTDGRNGLAYDLPAVVNCTRESHPGNYPCIGCGTAHADREHGLCDQGCEFPKNPLMVPEEGYVHLTVSTPGGYGTQVFSDEQPSRVVRGHKDSDFVGAPTFSPGSGTYVELNVPVVPDGPEAPARSWRAA